MAGEFYMLGVDPFLEYAVTRQDPVNGIYWEERWTGSATGINNLVASLNLSNVDTDQRYVVDESNRPQYSVTITTPDYNDGRSNALNKWDLVHEPCEKDLRESPWVKKNLTTDQVKYVLEAIKTNTPTTSLSFTSDTQAVLYKKLQKGDKKHYADARALVFSITTSKRFGVYASEVGVFKIWTTAKLMNPSYSGLIIPTNILFSLATVGSNNLFGATFTDGEVIGGKNASETYYWGWMKHPPDIENLSSGKIRISQKFLLDYWPTGNEYFLF